MAGTSILSYCMSSQTCGCPLRGNIPQPPPLRIQCNCATETVNIVFSTQRLNPLHRFSVPTPYHRSRITPSGKLKVPRIKLFCSNPPELFTGAESGKSVGAYVFHKAPGPRKLRSLNRWSFHIFFIVVFVFRFHCCLRFVAMVNRRPESGTAAVARLVPRPPSPGAVCSEDVQMFTIQYIHKSRHSQRIGLPSSLLFWALGVEMFCKPREILLSPPVERILWFLLVFPRGYP